MSLVKQLWLAIALVMLIAFGGSFLVSTLSARNYLEEQLRLKNFDNATSLAATLSQTLERTPGDEVTIELQIAAQFDLGHYESIRLVDPSGKVIRRYPGGNVTTSNVAFGGPKLDQLFVTGGLGPEAGAGGLFRLDLGVPGLKVLPSSK